MTRFFMVSAACLSLLATSAARADDVNASASSVQERNVECATAILALNGGSNISTQLAMVFTSRAADAFMLDVGWSDSGEEWRRKTAMDTMRTMIWNRTDDILLERVPVDPAELEKTQMECIFNLAE